MNHLLPDRLQSMLRLFQPSPCCVQDLFLLPNQVAGFLNIHLYPMPVITVPLAQ